jgi:catechol 2,3-dioxygenase-like lactoylglutathione lyase family enzyme
MPNKIDHVAFNVPDVRKAAQDFSDVFGIGSVLVFNEPLGLYIAVTDIGLVMSTEIDHANNPSPVAPIWANDLITAIEIKVPDRDAVHEKLLARGVNYVFEMYAPGGFREFFYDKTNFFGYPLTITEYVSESMIEAVDADLADAPEDYGQQLVWNWAPGYEGWSAKGKTYPEMADNIPSTSDSRIAFCALNFSGHLDAAISDFDKLFDMPLVKVTDEALGLRIALGDGGYFLYENLEESKPSRISSNFGAGVLGALGVRTNDLDGVTARFKEKGVKPIYEMSTPGGFRAVYFDKTFHGLPVLAVSYAGDSLLNAINPGLASDPKKYSADIRWHNGG